MNDDEQFEQRLRRQPVKQIPSAWREQILEQARAATPATHNSQDETRSVLHALWQRLFWPQSKAWAGLAAAWLVIFGLNFASRESTPRNEARHEAPPTAEMRRLLKQQELLLAELIERPAPHAAEPPKNVPTRPHSQRRDEFITA